MPEDPYTEAMTLCDPDGVVRRGAMHHGQDYECTGSAHFAGEHIRCTTPVHTAEKAPVFAVVDFPYMMVNTPEEFDRVRRIPFSSGLPVWTPR